MIFSENYVSGIMLWCGGFEVRPIIAAGDARER
jgi:hypothetical protein